MKQNLSSAETTVRQLKDQVQKLKTTVQQVRAQCANDIRKRDTELQKLKTHLTERQRGKREGLGVTTININRTADNLHKPEPDVKNPGYSLKQETTEFLTQLCQNLSDENDTLINLSRTTIQTLRELQGLSDAQGGDLSKSFSQGGAVSTIPTDVMDLSTEMDSVLDHLRTLLTNPSFVPLEEVELRDEEILRLREGWEKMEVRWRQAVSMMDGWHKRILDGGESIDLDELRKGMSLDSGLGRSITDDPLPLYDADNVSEDEEQGGHIVEEEEIDEPQAKILKSTLAKPPIRALGERNKNVKSRASNRKVSFYEGAMDAEPDRPSDRDETLQLKAHTSETVTQRSSWRQPSQNPQVSNHYPLFCVLYGPDDIHQTNQKSKLSIQEKLAAVEAEAKEAVDDAPDSKKRSRNKREPVIKKTRSRRRSTLTNDELDQLLGVSK